MKQKLIRRTVLLQSFIFIALGIYRSEVLIAFNKAINICLECIGIG
ncbi:CD1871A family CXXC motif-containing protein [Clostridium brassicae]|uniref:CD1871A family CXXC motif-containing protein n=1 Tax=Clostridium brassicae TaxID=2999072 RepID=A0ABT4D889_9CLOT|nr:CD1871A family CXXC motif-containing protein [Clostridium brassicae]MCY6958529.1 CD1871A family CXXC motif-containing protein [Clostridium brassicae]